MKTLTCTECGIQTNSTRGETWNAKIGYIIRPGEKLCCKCANKRKGYKTLTELNKERQGNDNQS
jgi:hypothetical protein